MEFQIGSFHIVVSVEIRNGKVSVVSQLDAPIGKDHVAMADINYWPEANKPLAISFKILEVEENAKKSP